MQRTCSVLLGVLATASPVMAQANPCNPCGPKAKTSAANPCNPCGPKQTAAPELPPVNPCHAKHGTVFYVADSMGRNQVTFASKAPLEDIVGTTNQIVGYLVFDPDKPLNGVRGFFRIPVKGLDTGIPLRDEHLQSDMWLDAGKYPEITFTVESASKVRQDKKAEGYQTYTMTLGGPLSIHGQTQTVNVPARITFIPENEKTRMKLPGNLLGVRAEFTVALADFAIRGPANMDLIGSRVGETVDIEVSAFASNAKATAGNPANPCNPCDPRGAKAKNPASPPGQKKGGR